MKAINAILMGGREVLPLIEGGKGISVSNGQSTGAWAAAGGVGTFSGVNADSFDEKGNLIPIIYKGKTRRERHLELIRFAIDGAVDQARIAFETAGGKGRIHMNVLWEMGGCEEILHGVLERTKGIISGVTCGAGMPYKIAEICASYNVHYYPIVSSARAFRALWRRAYHKFSDWLGGVVYEDPWLAGGHNGLSSAENPLNPESPYPRVHQLRQAMNEFGLLTIPVVMAGGVWALTEWSDWIDNPELGPVAFQFGTRPLLTQESPISMEWKKKLLTLKEGDVFLNKFSPTGFYSSAVRNPFLQDLIDRSHRQVAYVTSPIGEHTQALPVGARGREVYVTPQDYAHVRAWNQEGFTNGMRTPDSTLVYVTPAQEQQILQDQINCMGCLSACHFSNWSQVAPYTTGHKADPRSFCIQKTLQDISHGGPVDQQLMFAGARAYRFAQDPFYANGFIPTVKELVDRILTGF